MGKVKIALIGVGSAVLIATGGAVTAGAAQASSDAKTEPVATSKAGWKPCPKGALCLYTKKNGQGKVYAIWANTNRNFKHISSMWNNARNEDKTSALTKSSIGWACHPRGQDINVKDHTVDAVRWDTSCAGLQGAAE